MSDIIQSPVTVIGGDGGSAFSYNGATSGKVLTKIGVWALDWCLSAIRVWFTNDDPRTYGTDTTGSYQEFTFEDGEYITSMSLWGNGEGTRSGGIRFYTSTDREFFHYMTSWGLKQEYPIDVASGICVGIQGRSGDDIDCVGFMFLKPIASARLLNVSYPDLALQDAAIVAVTLDSYTDTNNEEENSKSWSFSGSTEVTVSSSWSMSNGIEMYASIKVKAGIPEIAQVEEEFKWSVSSTETYGTSNEETRTLTWSQSGELKAGDWVSVVAVTRRGDITVTYDGTMEITLVMGAVFSYPLSGQYAGVDYSSVAVTSEGD